MWLPTQAQINTAGRYATVIASTAIGIFGLQAKGFSLDQVKDVIAALGGVINNLVILASAVAAVYAAVRGVSSSSPTGQAAAIGANSATIVQPKADGTATVTITDPAMATAAVAAQKTNS